MATRTAGTEEKGLFIPMGAIIGLVIIVGGSFITQLILAAGRDKDIAKLQTEVTELKTWKEEHTREHFQTAIQLNNTLNKIESTLHFFEWQANPKKATAK